MLVLSLIAQEVLVIILKIQMDLVRQQKILLKSLGGNLLRQVLILKKKKRNILKP